MGDKEAFCGKYSVKNPWFLYKDEETGMTLGQSVRMVKTSFFKIFFFPKANIKLFLHVMKIGLDLRL